MLKAEVIHSPSLGMFCAAYSLFSDLVPSVMVNAMFMVS